MFSIVPAAGVSMKMEDGTQGNQDPREHLIPTQLPKSIISAASVDSPSRDRFETHCEGPKFTRARLA